MFKVKLKYKGIFEDLDRCGHLRLNGPQPGLYFRKLRGEEFDIRPCNVNEWEMTKKKHFKKQKENFRYAFFG